MSILIFWRILYGVVAAGCCVALADDIIHGKSFWLSAVISTICVVTWITTFTEPGWWVRGAYRRDE